MNALSRCALGSVILFSTALVGCSAVNPDTDYRRASRIIADATGTSATTMPSEGRPDFAPPALLGTTVTVDEAVQFCLLNNPKLLAAFYDIGIARADLVQSTLFSNPTLAMSIAFPDGGGLSNIQATFAQNIVDLWQIPFRRRVADRALDAEIMLVARLAVEMANEVRSAYFTAAAADQTVSISEENAKLASQLLDIAQARQKAGTVGELDVNLARGTQYSTELDLQRARLDMRSARRRLAIALGVATSIDEVRLTTPLVVDRSSLSDTNTIAEIALANRPDIRAGYETAQRYFSQVRLEYLKVFPDFSIGFYDERNEARSLPGRNVLGDTARASVAAGRLTAPEIQSRRQRQQERSQEITNIFGPAFNLTLPIFDQNQAQIAKARMAYERALAELDSLERAAVQQVRQAVDQAQTTFRVANYYRDKLLPQANENLDLSRDSYEVGRSSIIVLLDAQRILLSTRRETITADRDHAIAIAELERVTARPYAMLVDEKRAGSDPSPPAGDSK